MADQQSFFNWQKAFGDSNFDYTDWIRSCWFRTFYGNAVELEDDFLVAGLAPQRSRE